MSTLSFENLVLELSPEERASMLSKLNDSVRINTEALHTISKYDENTNYIDVYKGLGLIQRILVTIMSWIKHVGKDLIIKDRCLKDIIVSIQKINPNLYDEKRASLGEVFVSELSNLKVAARYFYDLLDKTLEKNRSSFYAFLVSLDFEDVHNELCESTDPYIFALRHPDAPDLDVRSAINSAMDSALSQIDETSRKSVYQDVKSLFILKKLSSFPFDKLLSFFHTNQSGTRDTSVFSINDQLIELDSILSAFSTPPSTRLMETILGFAFNEELGKEEVNVSELISKEIINSERALSTIRRFNNVVPLALIVKVSMEDPNYQGIPVTGGEDWFSILKSYWKNRVDRAYLHFVSDRRIEQLNSDIESLVGVGNKSNFVWLTENGNDNVPPVKYTRVLYFLESFYYRPFLNEINKVLKIILLDGEFYKRDNRVEFTDAYDAILQVGDHLKLLDTKLHPEAQLGLAYSQAKKELSSTQIKKRKVESAIKNANSEAENIIVNASEAMKKMSDILDAILYPEKRGRYDTLINLNRIDGSANKEFLEKIEESKLKINKGRYVLDEMFNSVHGI